MSYEKVFAQILVLFDCLLLMCLCVGLKQVNGSLIKLPNFVKMVVTKTHLRKNNNSSESFCVILSCLNFIHCNLQNKTGLIIKGLKVQKRVADKAELSVYYNICTVYRGWVKPPVSNV